MRFEELIQRLSPGAFQTLPGPDAQAALAPRPRPLWDPGRVPADARPAAALALLYPREGEPVLLLTVRGAGLAKHRSQVSFPGGAIEGGVGGGSDVLFQSGSWEGARSTRSDLTRWYIN